MGLTKAVTSMLEFVEWVEEVADQFTANDIYEVPWFRGMSSAEFKLVPGLYRSVAGRDAYSDDELRAEFRRRALPLVAERPPRDRWEWYFLMQHYGVPTRLLDWTDSALVALYFAIGSVRLGGGAVVQKPAVWALNPWKLNKKLGFEGPITLGVQDIDHYLSEAWGRKPPQFPIAIDPTFIAQRMLVQHSHFTLHGYDFRGLDEMTKELELSEVLLQVVIDADLEALRLMRWRLAVLGISETTIFPDLGGLGRELSLEYGVEA